MQRRALVDPTKWFCVHTHPGKEDLAAARLTAQRFEVFYPQIEIKREKKAAIFRPFFPRYLFVGVSNPLRSWTPIRYTPGVSYVLSKHEVENEHTVDEIAWEIPEQLPNKLIEQIRRLVAAATEPPVAAQITKGSRVRVLNGPWQHIEAVCSWSAADRVRLLISVFGNYHQIEFSSNQVALV